MCKQGFDKQTFQSQQEIKNKTKDYQNYDFFLHVEKTSSATMTEDVDDIDATDIPSKPVEGDVMNDKHNPISMQTLLYFFAVKGKIISHSF